MAKIPLDDLHGDGPVVVANGAVSCEQLNFAGTIALFNASGSSGIPRDPALMEASCRIFHYLWVVVCAFFERSSQLQ